ncbi:hypothetical protein FS749_014955 [Ceratobasidium sp. UAMH 11750]|nr:hypothetical protein FS749_014955 [Ceratobasidium sp. UAMH 11750]
MPFGVYQTVRDRIASRQGKTRTPTPEPTTASYDLDMRRSIPLCGALALQKGSLNAAKGARPSVGTTILPSVAEAASTANRPCAGGNAQPLCEHAGSVGTITEGQTDIDVDDIQIEADDIDLCDGDIDICTDADVDDTQAEAPAPRGRSKGKGKMSVALVDPPAPKPNPPAPRPRGRSRTTRNRIRSPTRSPTPGSTDVDPAELEFVSGKTPAGSQYTYVYETVDHDTLLRIAKKKIPQGKFDGWSTQDILQALQVVENDETSALAASRRAATIEFLSPKRIAVGGGWHHDHPALAGPAASGSQPAKRPSDAPDEQPSKRPRPDPAENTDTEPESEDEIIVRPLAPSAAAPVARPLTREATATTVPELQPSRPQSVVGSQSQHGKTVPKLPMLLGPLSGPTQARLRARLLERVADHYLEELEGQGADGLDKLDPSQHCPGDEPRQRSEPSEPSTPVKARKTYGKTRSHLPSDPKAVPPARPNSPTMTQTTLLEIERTRARLEKERAALDAARSQSAAGPSRPRTTAESSRARAARSLIGAATHADPPAPRQPLEKPNRRLDPISAARADMLAFNNEVTQGNTESFLETVRRRNRRRQDQDERTGRCGPIERSLNDLLSDDEELLAQIEAFAKGKNPRPNPPRHRRNRKKKPLARDFSGIRRQVLVLAKLHLFAFALAKGIYQTRLTFMEWAAEIHYETWKILLPKVPYEAATQAELEVMVNYIATFRGKAKDRLRPVVAHIHEFQHRIASQEDIQRNLDIFNLVYPNSFHCTWQFCLEEWSNGWWESRDLGAAHMLDKYEAHLAGLKNLQAIAGNRLSELQDVWLLYAEQYSGTSFIRPRGGQAITLLSELRPDTPEPECATAEVEIDDEDEELDERLIQAARLASLKQAAIERSAWDEGESRAGTPTIGAQTPDISRSPSPAPRMEYNEHGYITARSKGKGQAN